MKLSQESLLDSTEFKERAFAVVIVQSTNLRKRPSGSLKFNLLGPLTTNIITLLLRNEWCELMLLRSWVAICMSSWPKDLRKNMANNRRRTFIDLSGIARLTFYLKADALLSTAKNIQKFFGIKLGSKGTKKRKKNFI